MTALTVVLSPAHGATLTLDQRAGQLVGIGFAGRPTDRELEVWIRQRTPALVVLYRSNVLDPGEMAALTSRIGEAAPTAALAPLIAIDQEGGTVIRYDPAMLPGAMALGAAGSPELAYRAALHVGTALRTAGILVNLAPVADLSAFPDGSGLGSRSFGRDPGAVASLVSAYVRGLNAAGVLAIIKHFPGHGFADRDPHEEEATAVRSAQQLREEDLVPFRAAFAAGADGVMTAHVAYPALDSRSTVPATLSRPLLTDLLRKELGFGGLVITDVLHMKGVAGDDRGEMAVRALEAGADIVLAPNVREREEVFRAVRAAVESGRLSERRVDESLRRISEAREALEQGSSRASEANPAEQIARNAMTNIGGTAAPSVEALFVGVDGPLARSFDPDRRMVVPFQPSPNQIRTWISKFQRAMSGESGWIAAIQNGSQADLVREMRKAAPESPLTLILLGSPYDAVGIEADRYLFGFGFHEVSQEAVLAVLRGERCAPGRLPIEVPGIAPMGAGELDCLSSGGRESR